MGLETRKASQPTMQTLNDGMVFKPKNGRLQSAKPGGTFNLRAGSR